MKTLAVLNKEFTELRQNRALLFTLLFMPVLILALPLSVLYFGQQADVTRLNLEPLRDLAPDLAQLSGGELLQIFALNQFLFLFLLIPMVVPMSIATSTIISEKEQRSLEPLLATPIRVWELVLGKSLAASAPAIITNWACYGVFLGFTWLISTDPVFDAMITPTWLLAILLLSPLLTLLSVNLGVLISSRLNDARVAQHLGGLLVVPVVGLAGAQISGRIALDASAFVLGSLVLALVDLGLVLTSTWVFQREHILTRWR